jgi:pimeloyl-ACP methyl ester carboxylesterase
MRPRVIAALAACAVAAFACGGGQKHADDPDEFRGGSEPFVDASGFTPTSFTVEVKGEGRPVILIPGLGCPGSVWDETVAHLSGFQTHTLTLAGFAGVPRIKKALSATVRKELVRYIRSNHLEKPVIVGHSLGGFIAYWLAATAPNLIGGVIVVDAGPALSDTDPETAKQLRELWTQAEDAEFAQQVQDVFVGMSNDRARMTKLVSQIQQSDRRAMGDAIYEVTTTDIRDRIPNIRAPVLLVLADGGYQQRYRQEVSVIKHVDVHVLPHTHHFVMFDDPKGFFALVDAFLSKLPVPRGG